LGAYCYAPNDFEDVVAALAVFQFGMLNWIGQ